MLAFWHIVCTMSVDFIDPTLRFGSDLKKLRRFHQKMTIYKSVQLTAIAILVFALAGIAAAQGPVVGSSTTTSELAMTATVETAVQLNISTGSGGSAVSGSAATGLFSINFGNINGLGAGTPAAGVTVVTNGSGALYKTPVNLTPVYSGFTTETATIEVEQDAGGDTAMAREADSAITFGSTVSTMTPASVTTGAASGTPIERWVGMYADRTEAAGPKTATLIYTITVED